MSASNSSGVAPLPKENVASSGIADKIGDVFPYNQLRRALDLPPQKHCQSFQNSPETKLDRGLIS